MDAYCANFIDSRGKAGQAGRAGWQERDGLGAHSGVDEHHNCFVTFNACTEYFLFILSFQLICLRTQADGRDHIQLCACIVTKLFLHIPAYLSLQPYTVYLITPSILWCLDAGLVIIHR